MTSDQKKAYEWAKNQNYPSVAARYAKELAGLVDELQIASCARQEQERNAPLTLDELSKRNDPVFVPIKDFPNGGYWCLCQNGYIIPPSGYGFMAKERPNWVFYRQKPEEGTD